MVSNKDYKEFVKLFEWNVVIYWSETLDCSKARNEKEEKFFKCGITDQWLKSVGLMKFRDV